jgi:hypothetical protein
MSALTTHDLQAADLSAPDGLDDDGAPCPGGPQRPQPVSPVPDMTTIGRAPGSPGVHGPATASRGELIAAAPDRARQQLTPALMGIG